MSTPVRVLLGADQETFLPSEPTEVRLVKVAPGDTKVPVRVDNPVDGLTEAVFGLALGDSTSVWAIYVNSVYCGKDKAPTVTFFEKPEAPPAYLHWDGTTVQLYSKFFATALVQYSEAKTKKSPKVAFRYLVDVEKMDPAEADALTLRIATFVTTFELRTELSPIQENLAKKVQDMIGVAPKILRGVKEDGVLCLY